MNLPSKCAVLIGVVGLFFAGHQVAYAAVPAVSSTVLQNSTSTSVDVYITGSSFNSFVHTLGYTADATDLANITYGGIHPTSAVIDEAGAVKHLTLTFPISLGTAKTGGDLTIAAGTIKNSTTQNSLITITDPSITDSARPVVISVIPDYTGQPDQIFIQYSEIVTNNTSAAYSNFGGDLSGATIINEAENDGTDQILLYFSVSLFGYISATLDISSDIADLAGNHLIALVGRQVSGSYFYDTSFNNDANIIFQKAGTTFTPFVFTRSGGTPFDSYAVASGTIPVGLNLSTSTGALTGTLPAEGRYAFTLVGIQTPYRAEREFYITVFGNTEYEITNCDELQNMLGDLEGNYTLANDIDCSETSTWTHNGVDVEGFYPVGGTALSEFIGTFNGNGHTISNLFINRPGKEYVGLFGSIGPGAQISNVVLSGVDITGNTRVGGLVGDSYQSTVTNATTTGLVHGRDNIVGGLVGANKQGAVVSHGYSSVTVSSEGETVGGLTGANGGLSGRNGRTGVIDFSYATGEVTGSGEYGDSAGGLVGFNESGVIKNSYATGNVSASSENFEGIGGFVGKNADAYIWKSFALGNVSGASKVGGFAGANGGVLKDVFSRGTVTGSDDVGGIAGRCGYRGTVQNAYTIGLITGADPSSLGGVVGNSYNGDCTVTNSYWDVDATGITEEQNASLVGAPLATAFLKDQETYPTIDASIGYGLQSIEGGVATGRYVKWHITGIKSEFDGTQASEFILRYRGATVDLLPESGITNPDGDAINDEAPESLIDFKKDTKWLDYNFDNNENNSTIIIDAGADDTVTFDRYTFITGNDSTERDPTDWELYVSDNGTDWTLVDSRSGVEVTDDRETDVSGLNPGWDFYGAWDIDGVQNDGYPFLRIPNYFASNDTDEAAPIISSVDVVPSTTSATFTWNTNEVASSKILYSLRDAAYSETEETNTSPRVTSHSVTVSNLLACTSYFFKVYSADASANSSHSTAAVFTTTGCSGGATPDHKTVESVDTTTAATTSLAVSSNTFSVVTPSSFTTSSSSVVIQIKALDKDTVLGSIGLPGGLSGVGTIVFDVKALIDNETELDSFDVPVTITYQYSDSDVVGLDESSLTLYHYHSGSWAALDGCTVNTAANTITCTTPSFSIFSLFGRSSVANSSRQVSRSGGGSVARRIALAASVAATAPVISRDLHVGLSGDDVKALQVFLVGKGYIIPAGATGYFGNQTKAALISYQKDKKIAPSVGYCGPLTRASIGK